MRRFLVMPVGRGCYHEFLETDDEDHSEREKIFQKTWRCPHCGARLSHSVKSCHYCYLRNSVESEEASGLDGG